MAARPVARRPPDLPPKHKIFLSHSGQDKAFAEQLSKDLEELKLYSFFDQDRDSLPIGKKFAPLILDAAEQCRVAVVVLSPGYLQSKWPMLELIKFHESIKKGNPVTLVPLFYKLTPDDLRVASPSYLRKLVNKVSPKNAHSKESHEAHKEAVKRRWEEWKRGWRDVRETRRGQVESRWEEWKRGWRDMRETRRDQVVFDEKLCEDAIKALKNFNGMIFTGRSEHKYREEVVEEIYKLAHSTFLFDTSDIRGYERLCQVISNMFVDRQGTKFLGLYGNEGSGKTTYCCEAMCSHFQDEFQGRVCRVELEFDTDSKAAGKKRAGRLRQVLKDLFHTDRKLQAISTESQLKLHLKEKLRSQRVFLVVDNVSQSSREEAEFYVKAGFAQGSKVLVTSRNQKILEAILQDEKCCHPIPGLEKKEASELILSKAASRKLTLPLDPDEEMIIEQCLARGFIGGRYNPLKLKALATFLQASAENDIPKWVPILESLPSYDINSLQLLEYEKLDKASKLVFLDLAIFTDSMRLTHEDFHREMVCGDHKSFQEVVTYIALLHGVTIQQAKMKVRKLLRTPVVAWRGHPRNPEIWVTQSYMSFAQWLTMREGNREEKDWCLVRSMPEEEVSSEDELESGDDQLNTEIENSNSNSRAENLEFADLPNGRKLVRVSISRLALAYRDHQKIQQWRYVACVELRQVSYLKCLDLQGLHSLRVLMVEECKDLERIVCTCESSLSKDGPHLCYDQNGDQAGSGCMPNLRFVQLAYLQRLKCASFTVHCWSLETLWFFMCANLERLPDLQHCRKLKKLRLPCGDFQGFQGLRNNRALTELAFHWDPDTVSNFTQEMKVRLLMEMMSLEKLRVLDIVDERQVYEWIPAGFRALDVTKLVHLKFLDLSYATTIEEVVGLQTLSQLEALGLYGCCSLLMLPDLTHFQHLKFLCIGQCHNLHLHEDELPWYVKNFHQFGESCSFGEHECLNPLQSCRQLQNV